MSTLKVNTIQEADGSAFSRVLQVVRNDADSSTTGLKQSTTSSSFSQVTSLNTSITPKATGSKLYVRFEFNFSHNGTNNNSSSEFEIRDNISGDNFNTSRKKTRVNDSSNSNASTTNFYRHLVTFSYLVTAPNTNAIQFSVYFRAVDSNTTTINHDDLSNNAQGCTIMEIAA